MSLIGSKPVKIEDSVTLTVTGNSITVKGPKGELSQTLPLEQLNVEIKDGQVWVTRKDEEKQTKAFHGLVRSIIQNMTQGVTVGFSKRLELIGTGYRVTKQGKDLSFTLGYSHPIEFKSPEGINLDVEGNNIVIVGGIDKQQVGQIAAEIRALRKPEPYKGKGVKYEGEVIRRKAGKTTSV